MSDTNYVSAGTINCPVCKMPLSLPLCEESHLPDCLIRQELATLIAGAYEAASQEAKSYPAENSREEDIRADIAFNIGKLVPADAARAVEARVAEARLDGIVALTKKWAERYCEHWRGAYCDICTAKELQQMLKGTLALAPTEQEIEKAREALIKHRFTEIRAFNGEFSYGYCSCDSNENQWHETWTVAYRMWVDHVLAALTQRLAGKPAEDERRVLVETALRMASEIALALDSNRGNEKVIAKSITDSATVESVLAEVQRVRGAKDSK